MGLGTVFNSLSFLCLSPTFCDVWLVFPFYFLFLYQAHMITCLRFAKKKSLTCYGIFGDFYWSLMDDHDEWDTAMYGLFVPSAWTAIRLA